MLKFVTRSLSWVSRPASAVKIFCWPAISFDRSCVSVPSVAWFTIAVWRSESAAVSSDELSAWPAVLPRTSGT